MNLSVIFPAFNEEGNIEQTVDSCIAFCVAQPKIKQFEVIVVDDGSADRTGQILQKYKDNTQVVVCRHDKNKGYGAALTTGFRKAIYPWVFYMDSDRQFDINELQKFLVDELIDRTIYTGIRAKRKDNVFRVINATIYKMALRVLFSIRATDINCAFKLIPRSFLQSINLVSTGATINAELFYLARKKDMTIKEFPVTHYSRVRGVQTGANIKVVVRAMASLIRLRCKYLY